MGLVNTSSRMVLDGGGGSWLGAICKLVLVEGIGGEVGAIFTALLAAEGCAGVLAGGAEGAGGFSGARMTTGRLRKIL